MFKKHKFPVQIFLIFENLSLLYWTSTAVKPNHAITFLPAATTSVLGKFLKSELILANSFLVEASAIDTAKYSSSVAEFDLFFKKNNILLFYIFYFYSISYKITFCFESNNMINSLESSYKNANWLERELIEMYGLNFYNKSDSRNLLLDYTIIDNPMLKEYPCSGLTEVFYNPLEESVVYYSNTSVEL